MGLYHAILCIIHCNTYFIAVYYACPHNRSTNRADLGTIVWSPADLATHCVSEGRWADSGGPTPSFTLILALAGVSRFGTTSSCWAVGKDTSSVGRSPRQVMMASHRAEYCSRLQIARGSLRTALCIDPRGKRA